MKMTNVISQGIILFVSQVCDTKPKELKLLRNNNETYDYVIKNQL